MMSLKVTGRTVVGEVLSSLLHFKASPGFSEVTLFFSNVTISCFGFSAVHYLNSNNLILATTFEKKLIVISYIIL